MKKESVLKFYYVLEVPVVSVKILVMNLVIAEEKKT